MLMVDHLADITKGAIHQVYTRSLVHSNSVYINDISTGTTSVPRSNGPCPTAPSYD